MWASRSTAVGLSRWRPDGCRGRVNGGEDEVLNCQVTGVEWGEELEGGWRVYGSVDLVAVDRSGSSRHATSCIHT